MKKFMTLIICFVLVISAISFGGCTSNKITVLPSNPSHSTDGSLKTSEILTSKVFMSLGKITTFSTDSDVYLERIISAEVIPNNATNKLVDYSVNWKSDAQLKNADVSEYVRVIQDSEGSLTAKVRCYKSFGKDKIIITCKTRDGEKTATCEVSYQGLATEMNITSSNGLSVSNSSARGDYYNLYTGKDYNFTVSLTDFFGNEVDKSNLEFEYGSVGEVSTYYVNPSDGSSSYSCFTENNYKLMDGVGSYCISMPIVGGDSSYGSLESWREKNGASKFSNVSFSDGLLKISPITTVEYSYISYDEDFVFSVLNSDVSSNVFSNIKNYFNYVSVENPDGSSGFKYFKIPSSTKVSHYVPMDNEYYYWVNGGAGKANSVYDSELGFYKFGFSSNSKKLSNAYFYVTVTDSVSGLSQTIKYWNCASVQNVKLNLSNFSF